MIQPFLDDYRDYYKIEQSNGNDNTIIKITCTDTNGYRKAVLENIDIEETNEIYGYDVTKEKYKNYIVEIKPDQDLNIMSLETNLVTTFNDLQSEYHQTHTFSDLNEPTFTLEEIKAMLTEAKEKLA